jgi:aldose 1-epimerase
VLKDPNKHDALESYITGILTHYRTDKRILFWDMYNETGNTNDTAYGNYEPKNKSDLAMTLLCKVWKWARQVNPEQPITVCVWRGEWAKDGAISELDRFALENSDIITFHNYADANSVSDKIKALQQYGRPIVCTEYMSRSTGSTFQNILPLLKKNRIGAINWGFVAGKTQTNYPWDSWTKKYTAEPGLWFHDIFRTDGTPYSVEEVKFIRTITKDCNMPANGHDINKPENKIPSLAVNKKPFGKTPDGQQVDVYTLTNKKGMRAEIMNYGAALISLIVPDRNGQFADIVPGYDSFEGYLKSNPYFGGIVGRFGNRIAKGKFTLDGVEYTLATNNNGNHLHGGKVGFDRVVWDARSFKTDESVGVKLNYLSKDGEEGYPGNLNVMVTYTLTNNNELKIDYDATTDKATPVNLTQHGYWNLAGAGNGDILSHMMMINADRFVPTDETAIPSGELRPVKGTPMDFTKPTAIGARINDADDQLKYGKGYDHNWVLNKTDNSMTLACRVYEPVGGRMMEIYTAEPGLQFYSGNFLDGTIIGKGGKVYNFRNAIVLETQHFPDSPNHPNFPSTILRPGEKYDTHTIIRFSAK